VGRNTGKDVRKSGKGGKKKTGGYGRCQLWMENRSRKYGQRRYLYAKVLTHDREMTKRSDRRHECSSISRLPLRLTVYPTPKNL
jgi:hypothetical protein